MCVCVESGQEKMLQSEVCVNLQVCVCKGKYKKVVVGEKDNRKENEQTCVLIQMCVCVCVC